MPGKAGKKRAGDSSSKTKAAVANADAAARMRCIMADAAGDIDMAPLEELIEIRREQAHIREFQGKAEEKKTEVDSVVFQRVLDDYNKRHGALETRAAPLKLRARQ